MNKLFTILFILLLTSNLFAQRSTEKGSLLLEGNLAGVAWSELSTTPSIGIYWADGFAMTINSRVGLIEDETYNFGIGARIHFTESQLLKVDIAYDGTVEEVAVGLGFANRFYFKDWLSIQPQVGFYYVGESLFMSTGVGFNLHFERW
tara:strand:- start:205 stop:648 length:444 start_codon:yes stop_codon:yes gene_type:complete